MIDVSTLDGAGSFKAYRADPPGTPRAAIVVIQEIFGVNPSIRRKCDRLARDGYLALAPDLFWRIEPGIELDPDVSDQMTRALSLFPIFDQDHGIADLEATTAPPARRWAAAGRSAASATVSAAGSPI